MRQINEKLAGDLAEVGKKEFLAKGFQGASLRNIAAMLGVTTGAIYRYYLDKEALFDALVAEPAKHLEDEYRRMHQAAATLSAEEQLTQLPEVSDDGANWMMAYLYDHFDAFKMIACSSAGTKYEHYIDTLSEIEENGCHSLLDRMAEAGMDVPEMDDELIHILASALFAGMFETVRHDMPREKAMKHMRSLRDFYSAGWFKLLGI